MWLHDFVLSLAIPAPLSSRERPLEVPQRKGCWSLWADSLKPRCQTDQQAGQQHTERHTQRWRDRTGRQERRKREKKQGEREREREETLR